MIGLRRTGRCDSDTAKAAAALLMFAALSACSGSDILGTHSEPPAAAPPPAPALAPPPPAPPPVDLAGRWQLSAASGGACFMNFADAANAPAPAGATPQGTIAPEGGCPGNFFMSRKWTFENGALIIHDFKGRPLAQLSYSDDRFEGQDTKLGALTLSKPM